jgi:hypothetical protein
MESGLVVSVMDAALCLGLMEPSMKANGAMDKLSAMENLIMQTETSMKYSGAIIRQMEQEHISMQKELGMKESGKMISSTATV